MTAARNKRNYLDAKRAFNHGDLDACMAFYAPDHWMRSGDQVPGREHIHTFLASMHATWDDIQIVPEHVVAESDWVMGRCLSSATHSRPIMGVAPTGRRVETVFWDLHLFDTDGLIRETWNLTDTPSILRQLRAPAG